MYHIDLLGSHLKCDVLCDLFETYDVQVIYEYDRTKENLPDSYRTSIPDLGLGFVFNSEQNLETLFMESKDISTFNPFKSDQQRIPRFASKAEAFNFATSNELRYSQGSADFMGKQTDWIRFEQDTYTVHYEFVNLQLAKITLQIAAA